MLKVITPKKGGKENSPYALLVRRGNGPPKKSSFWPNSWSTERLKSELSAIYLRELVNKGPGLHRGVDTGYGYKATFRVIADGSGGAKIVNAFPEL